MGEIFKSHLSGFPKAQAMLIAHKKSCIKNSTDAKRESGKARDAFASPYYQFDCGNKFAGRSTGYNMKFSGEDMILRGIFHVVSY